MKCYSWKICVVALLVVAVALDAVSAKKKTNKYEGDFEFVDEQEDKTAVQKLTLDKKKWIHDPSSDLCRPLNCKKRELCLLEDANTAVCVSKKELHKTRDEVLPKTAAFRSDESASKWKWPDTDTDSTDEGDLSDDDVNPDDDIFYDSEANVEEQQQRPEQDQQQQQDEEDEKCKRCAVTKPIFVCASDNRTYSSLCRLDYHNCIHGTSLKVVCKGFCPCRDQVEQQQKKLKANTKSPYRATFDNMDRSANTVSENDINAGQIQTASSDSQFNFDDDKTKMSNRIPSMQSQQSQYQFTPEDIKFDNKHYKYLKYTPFNGKSFDDSEASVSSSVKFEDKHKYRIYNEGPAIKSNKNGVPKYPVPAMANNKIATSSSSAAAAAATTECKAQQLTAIGNRLLDWFSVIMADSKKRRQHSAKPKGRFPPSCKMEAKWMFGHLDLNNDGLLSPQELYDLEHDQNERCIKPFIDTCSMDQDSTLNPREWCRCFEKTDRPCAAVRRRLSKELLGSYSPDCDMQGFYKATQCHSSVGVCWCVDKHGVEFANTRSRGNKPNCDEVINSATATITSDDEDDDDSAEGSADRMLVF